MSTLVPFPSTTTYSLTRLTKRPKKTIFFLRPNWIASLFVIDETTGRVQYVGNVLRVPESFN
jgi:hypothetical protein